MTQPWKNVVVVGGSYVGLATAKELAEPGVLPEGYRVLVVEKHSRECRVRRRCLIVTVAS